ncbi:hypothetical protein NG2371_06575 [Nocardia gamkensis]|nr:hypothetical protein [Nocardia gamkensis]
MLSHQNPQAVDEPTAFEAYLLRTVAVSSSRFLETRRLRGWTDERIAEEISGMLLAGWGLHRMCEIHLWRPQLSPLERR